MKRFPRSALAGLAFFAAFAAFGSGACSSDTAVATTDGGGGGGEPDGSGGGGDGSRSDDAGGSDVASDATKTDGGGEAGTCPQGVVKPATGETCVGFGKKDPCNTACGEYGFVCFNGGPPAFTGCLQMSASAFGETYCCTTNKCVAQPDQDTAMCAGVAGKPHRYQCPPDGAGGNVAPPAGCVEKGSGGTDVEKFYCCP